MKKGQVLLFDSAHLEQLGNIAPLPVMPVDKFDSYGAPTGPKRVALNLLSNAQDFNINLGSTKELHPMVFPFHAQAGGGEGTACSTPGSRS